MALHFSRSTNLDDTMPALLRQVPDPANARRRLCDIKSNARVPASTTCAYGRQAIANECAPRGGSQISEPRSARKKRTFLSVMRDPRLVLRGTEGHVMDLTAVGGHVFSTRCHQVSGT